MRLSMHFMAIVGAAIALVLADCALRSDGPSVPKVETPVAGEQRPIPFREIPHPGIPFEELHFSPDGLMLAVVPARFLNLKHDHCARVYRVSDGALLRKLPGGSLRSAWNWDGSLLAVARDNWPDIEIWDVRTWTMKRRLTLCDAANRHKKEEPYCLKCGGLCFDRRGNLFVVEWSEIRKEHEMAFPYKLPRGVVFWNAADRWSEIDNAFRAISAGSIGETTRLACWDDGVAIWRLENSPIGTGTLRREYWIPEIGSPSICLSSDGKYLLTSNDERVSLFDLYDDHASGFHSQEHYLHRQSSPICDPSRDGRFVAYGSAEGVTVARIPSFQSVLQIANAAPLALSPDGRLLAADDEFVTRLYRIPDERKNNQDGRRSQ